MAQYLSVFISLILLFVSLAQGESPAKVLPCKSITAGSVIAIDDRNLLTMVRTSDSYAIRCGIIDDDGFVSMQILTFLLEKKAANSILDFEKKIDQSLDLDEKKAMFKQALKLKSVDDYRKFMNTKVQDWTPIRSALLKSLNKLIKWLEAPQRKSGHDAQDRAQELMEAKDLKLKIESLKSPVTMLEITKISEFLNFYQYRHGYTTVCKDTKKSDNYLGRHAVLTPIALGKEEDKPLWSQSREVTGFEDGLDGSCVDGIRGDPAVVARSILTPTQAANKSSPLAEDKGAR